FFLKFVADLLFLLGELASIRTHVAHVLVKLAGIFLSEIVPNLFEFLLRAGAGRERLRRAGIVKSLSGALHVRSGLIQLLPGIGHVRLVGRLLHALPKFINVGEQLALVFAQTFQSPAQLLFFRLAFGLLQRGLKFLDAFVRIALSLRQLLQPIKDCELFLLFRRLLPLRLALRFVTSLLLLQFELVPYLAIGLSAAPPPTVV